MTNSFHTYRYYKDENLVLCVFRGDIYLKDMLECFAQVWGDKDCNTDCIGITDIRNCKLHFTDEDIKTIHSLQNSHPKAILNKWSILADVPKSVAILMMYEMMVKEYDVAIFTTWRAATNHLSVSIEDLKINLQEV